MPRRIIVFWYGVPYEVKDFIGEYRKGKNGVCYHFPNSCAIFYLSSDQKDPITEELEKLDVYEKNYEEIPTEKNKENTECDKNLKKSDKKDSKNLKIMTLAEMEPIDSVKDEDKNENRANSKEKNDDNKSSISVKVMQLEGNEIPFFRFIIEYECEDEANPNFEDMYNNQIRKLFDKIRSIHKDWRVELADNEYYRILSKKVGVEVMKQCVLENLKYYLFKKFSKTYCDIDQEQQKKESKQKLQERCDREELIIGLV